MERSPVSSASARNTLILMNLQQSYYLVLLYTGRQGAVSIKLCEEFHRARAPPKISGPQIADSTGFNDILVELQISNGLDWARQKKRSALPSAEWASPYDRCVLEKKVLFQRARHRSVMSESIVPHGVRDANCICSQYKKTRRNAMGHANAEKGWQYVLADAAIL